MTDGVWNRVDMADRVVLWQNGALVDPRTAALPWSDHGITVGDGVFETIELRGGSPFALTRHLDRLERSCAGLHFPAPPRTLVRDAVDEVSSAWGPDGGRLRVTVTTGAGPMGSERGPGPLTLLVSATAMTVATQPTAVLTVEFTRNERGALAGLKTTSYGENVLALQQARDAGASEAIFANTIGELCEGTGSNVFVGIGGRLLTPPLSSGCLAGVTRALLLEALARAGTPATVESIPMGDWPALDEAFLVSTGRHVQPISRIDARPIADAPGPLTVAAARVWHDAYDDVVDP